MHGSMAGYFEVRISGPGRELFRLFCLLENGTKDELQKRGLQGPAVAVITGMRKPNNTAFSETEYSAVRVLGDDHKAELPRRLA